MMRAHTLRIAALLCAAAAPTLPAQSLESRVNAAPDGRVAFSYAARPGVCGDGRTYIQTGPNSFSGVYLGDGSRMEPCVAGPVRVIIDRADRLPLSVRAYVGPIDTTVRGVTDLGRVRAQDAVEYLLALAQKADGRAGRDATTDGMQTIQSSITDPILAIARDESDSRPVRQAALGVLGRLDHGAGIPSLMQLSQQTQSYWLAQESMSALARSGDPRARQYLRSAVRRTDLPDEVLVVALRSLGQEYATAQDAALLRDVYPTLSTDRAREAVFSALATMGGSENTKWLMGLASSESVPVATRRRALDAASRSGASISDLVKLYDTTTDPNMKDALVALYIRDGEKPAIDKLLAIIKNEENLGVRRRAIAQLGRSDDPRVRQALEDLVTK